MLEKVLEGPQAGIWLHSWAVSSSTVVVRVEAGIRRGFLPGSSQPRPEYLLVRGSDWGVDGGGSS